MRLELTGRHVDITPTLRRLVDKKLARVERMLNDSAVSAAVVLSHERGGRRADVSLHARGEQFLHSVGAAATWDASMRQAVDKLAQQAQRVKGKWRARTRHGPKPPAPAAGAPASQRESTGQERGGGVSPKIRMPRILRTTRQALKAMSVADALRQVAADGDGVLVFRDSETAAVSVLFRRPDGELMLVETEP
ncbi:MAG: ribosomal subunit interface protein [Acidobacteria bacterium RIFCSPLOWO2_02_FULL_65_29]|nr:MAG: ribosomal subunit interface protein [Acidobacteria bacterium RIFCSPLOWO2_02_FULL_65_29]